MKTLQKIIILGTAGNCVDILDAINDINAIRPTYSCVGFLDDNTENLGKMIHGVQVIGTLTDAANFPDAQFVNGIGSTNNFWKKKDIIARTGLDLERFSTIVHPTASVSNMSTIGNGTVVFQNVTITSNVSIGNHVIILPNSIVSHDSNIGDYTCIAGGACISGDVTIGHSCYIGTNSSIIHGANIGDTALIGMGSVVISDVDTNAVMIGNPARFLKLTVESM